MNSQTRIEIRFGLIALALTGALFTLGIAVRGPLARDNAALMQAALSPQFVLGAVIGLTGGVLQIFGLFGLYRYLTNQRASVIALLGVVFSVLGIVLVLPLATFLAVNIPVIAELYQQGNQEVIAVVESTFSGLGLALLGVSSVSGVIGAIVYAVALWRHGKPLRWMGAAWGLAGLMLSLSGPGLFITELLAAALMLVVGCALARRGWQESGVEAGHKGVPAT